MRWPGRRLRGSVMQMASGATGQRTPDHVMRETYQADWRGDAARSMQNMEEWSDPITPE
jgi:hypothetical protein